MRTLGMATAFEHCTASVAAMLSEALVCSRRHQNEGASRCNAHACTIARERSGEEATGKDRRMCAGNCVSDQRIRERRRKESLKRSTVSSATVNSYMYQLLMGYITLSRILRCSSFFPFFLNSSPFVPPRSRPQRRRGYGETGHLRVCI